jgi:5-methylcytosine-specific restriction endonuclease McrA
MLCELCGSKHDGSFGSGRFCSSKCARSFSTSSDRQAINKKRSETLKRLGFKPSTGFKKGEDPNRKVFTAQDRAKAVKSLTEIRQKRYAAIDWDDLPLLEMRRRILQEQNNACAICQYSEWNGKPLVLELDHINGNHKDNRRENLRILCPNCHSQTPKYRRKHAPVV